MIEEFLQKNPLIDFSTLAKIAILEFIKDPQINLIPVEKSLRREGATMSEQFNEALSGTSGDIIPFPISFRESSVPPKSPKPLPPTPAYDELLEEAQKLNKLSKYRCSFDYSVYRDLELRFREKPIRGGIVKSNPLKLVNSHPTCQQCLYSFEIDTYGRDCSHNCRDCSHNCTYCYAKAELTVHGYWNNPIPVPVDLNEIRKIFYTVFETQKSSKWRSIMERRIPLRIGAMSDSFMWMDTKYKVTQELLKILSFYRYPYTIITRSDLVARDDYMSLMRPELCSVQFSIASTNDGMNRLIEPGARSAKRRLIALEKLAKNAFWTAVRINPMFPIYPDGYFSNPDFKWDGTVPKFDYSSFEMVDEIAATGCRSVIAGFGRFSSFALNQIAKATGTDLRPFLSREISNSRHIHQFSKNEIRFYYQQLKQRADRHKIDFTVCYIGNGEDQFWEHQDLWSNKADCCNIKGIDRAFKTDAREIRFSDRLKFVSNKNLLPVDATRLHLPLSSEVEGLGLRRSAPEPNAKGIQKDSQL